MIIWKQWFTSVSDTGMEVYSKLAYFNEWSHSAVGQSAYVIMPNFAKLIAIPFCRSPASSSGDVETSMEVTDK